MIFRGRNFFVTLWLACLGLAFTIKSDFVPLLSFDLAILYWFFEGMMRYNYWYKYVDRYRFLRDAINSQNFDIDSISIYDATNHYHKKPIKKWQKFKVCFLKIEPTLLYFLMGGAAFLLWGLLKFGVITFANSP